MGKIFSIEIELVAKEAAITLNVPVEDELLRKVAAETCKDTPQMKWFYASQFDAARQAARVHDEIVRRYKNSSKWATIALENCLQRPSARKPYTQILVRKLVSQVNLWLFRRVKSLLTILDR